MKKLDILGFAFGNFFRRKARSVLTVLGVVIGTASVVIMLSIGIGMQAGFEEQISEYGNIKEITVTEKYDWDEETGQIVENASKEYLDEIGLAKIAELDHIDALTPRSQSWNVTIEQTTKQKAQLALIGISAADMAQFDYKILYGRLLNESDIGTNNYVMNYAAPFYFYGYKEEEVYWREIEEGEELPFDPLDETLKFKFTWDWSYGTGAVDTSKPKKLLIDANCVGVLAQDINADYNGTIYMDVESVIKLSKELNDDQEAYYASEYGYDTYYGGASPDNGGNKKDENKRTSKYSEFLVLCDDRENVQQLEKDIRALGFDTYSRMEYLTYMEEQTLFLRAILGAIGLVAFIVAAISIVNTMIMSIYERTREIGIMKVMGCKLSDIRGMFLIEAGIIGFMGGVVGIGASYGASAIINYFSRKGGLGALGIDGIGTSISLIPFWLDIVALLLATVVGIVSGLYPAIRATRLSALDAIKNE